jgi:hypothetical protein
MANENLSSSLLKKLRYDPPFPFIGSLVKTLNHSLQPEPDPPECEAE